MTANTNDSTPAATGSSHETEEVKDGSIHLDNAALDELNTAEALSLHLLMEDLTSCGVGNIVDLPQIIVVGEQSSGKSSVLEAITKVRFPVASGVCTRFATEIVIRKGAVQKVDVKIRFCGKPEEIIDQRGFSAADLPEIIEEAKVRMGLGSGNGREFSKDILHIEVEGPDMSPLTLVDLPGIFHVETLAQSDRGRETVNELVGAYMKQPNSIILVVVEANNQVARHAALAKAMAPGFDPKRQRTLGVITKPDLATKEDAMDHIRLAKNQDPTHKLEMGWHVLKNSGSDDTDDLDLRDLNEVNFFTRAPWSSILETDRGIGHLRTKLSDILYKHTRQSIPGVIDDIEEKLEERQEELKQYGEERAGVKEMLSFLLNLSSEFVRLTRAAIDGNYADDFFGDLTSPENRLRAELRSFHRMFDHTMKTKGQRYIIESRDDYQTDSREELFLTDTLIEFRTQRPYNLAMPPVKSRHDINDLLQKLAVENVGKELPGSCNSELAIQLFRELSTPWEEITKHHVDNVLAVSRDFVEVLFKHLMGDQNTYPALEVFVKEHIDPFFQEIQNDLDEKKKELLDPYTRGYAVPLDAEFTKLVKRWVAERLAKTLQSTPEHKIEQWGGFGKSLTQDDLARAIEINEVSDGGTFATERILDMAEAYYEMARRTFTDNIMNLAIERCLVRRLPEILTPSKVGKMEDEELRRVATEPAANSARRRQLRNEIATLKEGLSKCKAWQPLPTTSNSKKARDNSALAQVKKGKAKAEASSQSLPPRTGIFGSIPAPGPTPASINLLTKKAPPVAGPSKSFGGLFKTDKSQTPTAGGLFGPGSSALRNPAPSAKQNSPFSFGTPLGPPDGNSPFSKPPSFGGFSLGSSTPATTTGLFGGQSSDDGSSSTQTKNSESPSNAKSGSGGFGTDL